MNGKPKILGLVEEQTYKSYGERKGGKGHISLPVSLPPIFENVAICMACGKERYVNTCGFCENCWITFSHLRKGKPRIHRKEGT